MTKKNTKKQETELKIENKNSEQFSGTSETELKIEAEDDNNSDGEKQEEKKSGKGKKDSKKSNVNELEEKLEVMNDKYLRLTAEYDNYRKRTLKERMELIKSAGEDILFNFLPVMDNIDRAKQSIEIAKDIEAIKEGILLIHKNLEDFLKERGVTEIESKGEVFDTDFHEAITKIPAPEDELKGKVVDVIEKGYKIKDKVLRYAKVVVGE